MISIVVPVYNVEKYINKCVFSLINQTYKDLEIILVDDGATDSSGRLCDEWALRDNRIKVIHKENGGLSDARNAGIEKATGEYICFVDSDDYVDEKMFQSLYDTLIQNNADMCLCDFRVVNEGEEPEAWQADFESFIYSHEDILSDNYKIRSEAWAKLYKKEMFDNVRFPKGKYHEDEYTLHYLIYKAKKVVRISAPFYFYVQRQHSITARIKRKNVEDMTEALCDRLQFIEKNNWETIKAGTLQFLYEMLIDFYHRADSKSTGKRIKEIIRELNRKYKNSGVRFANRICGYSMTAGAICKKIK